MLPLGGSKLMRMPPRGGWAKGVRFQVQAPLVTQAIKLKVPLPPGGMTMFGGALSLHEKLHGSGVGVGVGVGVGQDTVATTSTVTTSSHSLPSAWFTMSVPLDTPGLTTTEKPMV